MYLHRSIPTHMPHYCVRNQAQRSVRIGQGVSSFIQIHPLWRLGSEGKNPEALSLPFSCIAIVTVLNPSHLLSRFPNSVHSSRREGPVQCRLHVLYCSPHFLHEIMQSRFFDLHEISDLILYFLPLLFGKTCCKSRSFGGPRGERLRRPTIRRREMDLYPASRGDEPV